MSVGTQPTKSSIDTAAALVCNNLEIWAKQIDEFQSYLLLTPDATLMAAPFGYTQAEVTLLKSALTDLAQLVAIQRGQQALSVAKDFRTFTKQLIGIGF